MTRYIGRFAPSPTGPLHAGSLVAALASWLDARAHAGLWLVRIEDVDTTRCLPGLDTVILQQLARCGLHSDAPPVYQTQRSALYQNALDTLVTRQLAYPCACTRRDIALAQQGSAGQKQRHSELVYPGTCRHGLQNRPPRAWRLRTEISKTNWPPALIDKAQTAIDIDKSAGLNDQVIDWHDRRLGAQRQDVTHAVGDFVLKRADGCFAYQLAVVVDDAAQGVTHVVRGQDLADNTARQILLQRALGLPTPHYLHTPLVLGTNGEKLSKQTGAQAVDTSTPTAAHQALTQAAQVLGLAPNAETGDLSVWVKQWRQRFPV